MNERIKELLPAPVNLNPLAGHPTLGFTQYQMEQFAELIVRECMTMCEETQAGYFKHRKAADDFQDKNIYAEGEAACDVIKYKMKKHFGVEE